ncbi:MAG: LAGLIDADG family homing endonuclease [Candidatus Woesearchaeota archaeon]
MDSEEQISKLRELIESKYVAALMEAAGKGQKSLVIDFSDLADADPAIAEELLVKPEDIIKAAELAVQEFDLPENARIRVRFKNLPATQKIAIRNIRSEDIGLFITIEGLVRQKSDVRPQVVSARFECPSCGNIISVLQLESAFKEPTRCGCGRKGKFRLVSKELVDAQGIVLEETPEALEGGEQPKRINIFLKEDLVSPMTERKTNPGSKIRIIGFVKEIPIINKGTKLTRFDLLVEANYVESIDEDFYDILINKEDEAKILELANDEKVYERLIASIAPSIYGFKTVKESLLMQLMGGVQKKRSDGIVSRGDIHILLVGDPGAGKSQILKRMSMIAPKGRYVSGKGVSGAGITASVVKDEFLGGWSLEAGALVLANNGLVSIDEMDKMSHEDRGAMHEAMEQQCLHYDSRITLADGSEQLIGEYVERLMKAHEAKIIHGKDCLILPAHDLNLRIFTTDWEKICETKINRISKHVAPKQFIKITAGNGRTVIVTPEHPFFCMKNGKIITKRSDTIMAGDWVPVPLKLPVEGAKQFFNIEKEEIFNKRSKHHIIVPVSNCSDFYKLIGYILSEGSKETNRGKQIGINFTNKNPLVLEEFCRLMKKVFGIKPYKQARIDEHGTRWMLRYTSRELAEFIRKACPSIIEKANRKQVPQLAMKARKNDVACMLTRLFEGDGHVSKKERTIRIGYTTNSGVLAEQVQDLLLRFGIRSNITKNKKTHKTLITGRDNLLKFNQNIGFVSHKKNEIVREYLEKAQRSRTVKDLVPEVSEHVYGLLKKYDVKAVGKYKLSAIRDNYIRRRTSIQRNQLQKYVMLLEGKVFGKDMELLQNLRKLAFGAIGFEKVRNVEVIENNDQVWCYDLTVEPNHTFVSQNMILHNTVSISKANIQATLLAKTTVLAAANPKFGRFDPYGIIAEQIDLPPTLINRFDLIFPIKDLPSTERDEKMARHILNLHQMPETELQEIPTPFLKKYVAYARQRVSPKLTDSALNEIKDFYVTMRNKGGGDERAARVIPISARQLEALVRLSEASARVRLSDKVLKKDARRAIDLITYCLLQVGLDRETGKIDIDRIATGIGASQRDKIFQIKEILATLENKIGKTIPIDDVLKAATERGIGESEAEEIIEKLKRSGDVYEPRFGFVSKI